MGIDGDWRHVYTLWFFDVPKNKVILFDGDDTSPSSGSTTVATVLGGSSCLAIIFSSGCKSKSRRQLVRLSGIKTFVFFFSQLFELIAINIVSKNSIGP